MVQKTEPVFTDFTWKTKIDSSWAPEQLQTFEMFLRHQYFACWAIEKVESSSRWFSFSEYWHSSVRRWEKSHPHLKIRRKTCTAEVQSTNKRRLCVSVGGIEPSAFSRYPTGAVVERRALNNRSVCRFNVFVITRPISNLMVSLWSTTGKNERWSQREKSAASIYCTLWHVDVKLQ